MEKGFLKTCQILKGSLMGILLFTSWSSFGQDSQQRIAPPAFLCLSGGFQSLIDDPSFQYITKKQWKLDKMYVNQTSQEDSIISNISLAIDIENDLTPNFLWLKSLGSSLVAKDYPLEFVAKANQSTGNCYLYQLKLSHKYNHTLMYTYTVAYASEATLVLTTTQKDIEDGPIFDTIEYRFVPKAN